MELKSCRKFKADLIEFKAQEKSDSNLIKAIQFVYFDIAAKLPVECYPLNPPRLSTSGFAATGWASQRITFSVHDPMNA
jgi:hypothetical protein